MTYGGIWWGCILFSFECHFFWSLLSSAESFRAKFIKQNVFGPGMYAEVVSNHFYRHRVSQKFRFWQFLSDNLPYLGKTGSLLSSAESCRAKFIKQNVWLVQKCMLKYLPTTFIVIRFPKKSDLGHFCLIICHIFENRQIIRQKWSKSDAYIPEPTKHILFYELCSKTLSGA